MDERLNPTYNLKAVVKETGIKPDTLRAWERRYGLPQPSRTSGKHRLYSQQDIDTLKWLVARQEDGLSISRAVNLYRSLEADGQDPLQMPQYAIGSQPAAPVVVEGRNIQELRREWLEACLDFDEQKAIAVLNQAFLQPPVGGEGRSEPADRFGAKGLEDLDHSLPDGHRALLGAVAAQGAGKDLLDEFRIFPGENFLSEPPCDPDSPA